MGCPKEGDVGWSTVVGTFKKEVDYKTRDSFKERENDRPFFLQFFPFTTTEIKEDYRPMVCEGRIGKKAKPFLPSVSPELPHTRSSL